MRPIKYIAVHYSATPAGMDIGRDDIDRWHKDRGWKMIGYHYVVRLDGTVESGRPLEMVGAHVKGYNAESIGICVVGEPNDTGNYGVTFTDRQWSALERLVTKLEKLYDGAVVLGHRDFEGATTQCPGFDVKSWWLNIKGGKDVSNDNRSSPSHFNFWRWLFSTRWFSKRG